MTDHLTIELAAPDTSAIEASSQPVEAPRMRTLDVDLLALVGGGSGIIQVDG